ncbi:hypothetical protein [Halobacteriovorax sp. HLS]|uniref:hypothetical protein n=1 Tax=Halobacteriovorax sp. HLS TaxID=2234000 RepID=UPI000FD7F926|nr:hypothetical protein [Halobacteriovorax sp. HLS]
MKKIILALLVLIMSSFSMAEYFSFPVHSISIVDGYDSVFVLESSNKMKSMSDRIYIDCQGFLAQIAFYNDSKNGQNAAPEELYDLDHAYCEYLVQEIDDLLEQDIDVCLSLNIESYELPKINEFMCEGSN